jgi:hypothetical protein
MSRGFTLWTGAICRVNQASPTAPTIELSRLAAVVDDHGVPDDEGGRIRT